MICKLSTNLLEYTLNLIISFDGINRSCVCKSIKMTKLVQARTIAYSSSAILEQHGSTRSSQHVEHVKTCRDEPSEIWAYANNQTSNSPESGS